MFQQIFTESSRWISSQPSKIPFLDVQIFTPHRFFQSLVAMLGKITTGIKLQFFENCAKISNTFPSQSLICLTFSRKIRQILKNSAIFSPVIIFPSIGNRLKTIVTVEEARHQKVPIQNSIVTHHFRMLNWLRLIWFERWYAIVYVSEFQNIDGHTWLISYNIMFTSIIWSVF